MAQGSDGERGTASALARTVPSDSAKVDELASADTMLAPEAARPPPVVAGDVLASRYRILGELGRLGERASSSARARSPNRTRSSP